MYLILSACPNFNRVFPSVFDKNEETSFTSHFTNDRHAVQKALKAGARVFSLEGMVELDAMNIDYSEQRKAG